jgi:hypothetical protein
MPDGGTMDLNRANPETFEDREAVREALSEQYLFHYWDTKKEMQGAEIRKALQEAAFAIITNSPPSADRSAALRKLREARMDANSAITHGGKY